MNIILLAMDTYNQSRYKEAILEKLNGVCSLVFVLELFLKVTGTGWQFYISQGWNRFDFVLVLLATVDLLMSILRFLPFVSLGM